MDSLSTDGSPAARPDRPKPDAGTVAAGGVVDAAADQLRRRAWARPVLGAAFGITLYWPIVSLAAVHAAQGAAGWSLVDTRDYWIVLPLISLWGAWGLWQSLRAERWGRARKGALSGGIVASV